MNTAELLIRAQRARDAGFYELAKAFVKLWQQMKNT